MTVRENHTIPSSIEINHVPDANVDYAEETLVLLFEFLLVKDLDCKNAVFTPFPTPLSAHNSEAGLMQRTYQILHSNMD